MHVLLRRSFLFFLLCALAIVSCTKDTPSPNIDDDTDNEQFPDDGTDNEPSPSDTDNSARLAAKELYEDYYLTSVSATEDVPWTGDEPSCNAGSVPEGTKEKIFMRLAYFRKAVGLNNEISENATKSEKAQKSALMMHANGTLDHSPPNSWKCFSDDGKEGAGNSLLAMARNAPAIDAYIRDQGSNNGPVGHRRWLLWPRLQEIGIGNTERANAIWVLGNAGTSPEDAPEFIAWPPEGYIPNNLVYSRWSFSIRNADFTATKVSMEDEDGNSVALSLEELDNAFGDRTIVWVPEAVNTNGTEDISYTVTLEDVNLNGEMSDFTYEVTLFDINN